MNTAPLPKEIRERFAKGSIESEKDFIQGCRNLGFDPIDAAVSQRGHGYFCGACSEYSRAQPLIEALEQFIKHHESGILPNRLAYDFAKLKLQQYNQQP